MNNICRQPLASYHRLRPQDKRLFSEALQRYIRELPAEGFGDVIIADFNRICDESVFPKMQTHRFDVHESTLDEIARENEAFQQTLSKKLF